MSSYVKILQTRRNTTQTKVSV